jgi:hypothetical protein
MDKTTVECQKPRKLGPIPASRVRPESYRPVLSRYVPGWRCRATYASRSLVKQGTSIWLFLRNDAPSRTACFEGLTEVSEAHPAPGASSGLWLRGVHRGSPTIGRDNAIRGHFCMLSSTTAKGTGCATATAWGVVAAGHNAVGCTTDSNHVVCVLAGCGAVDHVQHVAPGSVGVPSKPQTCQCLAFGERLGGLAVASEALPASRRYP